MIEKALILDEKAMQRALNRISYEIIERNHGVENIVIIGIQRRGVTLAKKIAEKIRQIENSAVPVGILDITIYRDDLSMLSETPTINSTDIPFSIKDKTVILVDDVLYTGRTIRAAIDALMDIGRPNMIQLAVLIDRGHREIPIHADYRGKNIPTSKNELVNVYVDEIDNENKVIISKEEK